MNSQNLTQLDAFALRARALDMAALIVYSFYGEENDMDAVTLSSKYQVVIPRHVRERMGLRAGAKPQVIGLDDRIELIPVRPMHEMRGFLKGLDPSFERERDDRA